MKTKYLFYVLICIMSIGKIKSADLYVRDLGAGGAYATISAAISAANDGDRIIIKPKTGNVPYLENVTINKSLTFVSETNFSKYYVQGTIYIIPATGRVVNIHNMYAFQSSIATTLTTITGGRCTINIINCTVDTVIDMDNTKNVTANVYGSTFTGLYFLHGKIIGNDGGSILLYNDASPYANSDVYISGNKVFQITSDTASYPINIMNNDISTTSSNPLIISNLKTGSTNTIQNNRISAGSYHTLSVIVSSTSTGNIIITNNILNSTSGSANKINVNTAAPTVIANYNLSSTTFSTTGVDIQSNNISNASYNLDLTNLTSSGAIVNAGVPDEEYQDLDLTRNDIGPLGGSNSWANYWPSNAGNKPRVMFLNTPRRVYLGTTSIQAEATGISK